MRGALRVGRAARAPLVRRVLALSALAVRARRALVLLAAAVSAPAPATLPLLVLALPTVTLVAGGCVRYPSVVDAGGTRIRTENGRAVPEGAGALVYFDVNSTGKYGDTILGVSSVVAGQARLVSNGTQVSRLEIPGATTVKFAPGGPHVVLADLQRPLTKGETFIVTLEFDKSGNIGVVTVVQ